MPAGRPSDYTTATAVEICTQIVEGKSLNKICLSDGMPDVRTVYRWLSVNEEFRQQYARAKEDQADTLADEIIDIADDTARDTIEVKGEDGSVIREIANTEWISRSRLRVDARKWIASKLKPKKYGERMELAGDPASPVSLHLTGSDVNG